MAPPSPRRSSRARATNSQSHQSSSSSGASGRAERNPRALNKTSSGKSTPSASLSSEPLEDFDDTLLGRRRKRGQDEDQDKASRQGASDMANGSDDPQDEEDEAVRCLCDSEEYPGRPPVEGADADFFAAIELTEDVTGFFVQCDVCKVWQHGACVGIFSAESSPDEYFCELCRKDLHKINTASNGQKYSKYLPLHRQSSRANSRATSIAKDRAQSPKKEGSKNLRPTSSQTSKRRSTMNSRDAAYDDEQLRRAIEASKEDNSLPDSTEGATRRTKRGRSDSEENTPTVKRQRTNSQSQSPPAEQAEAPSREQSDDETQARNGAKKGRNGREQRAKSEKEDKERQRQDAASKRKGRADRRRAEDSDPSEELPLAATKAAAKKSEEPANIEAPAAPHPTPGTPPAPHTTTGSAHKKGARSTHKKGKGKNQYTKDRDAERGESPARSMSRDIQKNADEQSSSSNPKAASEQKPSSKSKPALPHKMSMLDMKRRVGAIMDFISRTQVDLAAEGSISSNSNSTSGGASPQKTPSAQLNGEAAEAEGHNGGVPSEKDFRELNCMEMMDVLTRDMVKWQNQYT